MNDIALRLKVLFPDLDFDADCLLVDKGNGPRIARWSRPEPKPTLAELAAVVIPEAALALTARQVRLVLLGLGLGDTQVRAKIALIPDATRRAAALIEWEYATIIHSNHSLVLNIAAGLGLTTEQLRHAFTVGANL